MGPAGLSGGVRAYYQRSYSWQLCDSFTEPFFWYQESGKLKFVDVCCEVSGFDELVKFSALGGWNLAHLSEEEVLCYRRLAAASLIFHSKQFEGRTRSPHLDEEIRQAFTSALVLK